MLQVPKLQVVLLHWFIKTQFVLEVSFKRKDAKGAKTQRRDRPLPSSGLPLITFHLSLSGLPGGDEDGGTVVRDTYGQTGVRTEVCQSLDTGKIKPQT